jgi:septal ring factor EnvC (AmiA/AmiB activator)
MVARDTDAEPSLSGSDLVENPLALGRYLDKLNAELERLEAERQRVTKEVERAGARRVACGRAYVKLARAGLLPVGGGPSALVDHASRIARLRWLLERDTELEKQALRRKAEVSGRLGEIKRNRPPLDVQRELLRRAHAQVLAAEQRAQAFDRAFGQSGSSSHTAVYGAGMGPADPSGLASGFAGLRGRLPFPVAGRAEIATVQRKTAGGPGLEMRVRHGTPVRAVYAGRVAFADRYADYGMAVILDHGDGYFTVTGSLGAISVSVGDEVATGARIGSAGASSNGGLVYFEIRAGGQIVDPATWFGI